MGRGHDAFLLKQVWDGAPVGRQVTGSSQDSNLCFHNFGGLAERGEKKASSPWVREYWPV
jgi:hypothetical protein